jgi:hypothetical protein
MKRKSLVLKSQRDPERIQREFKQVRALLKYGVVALTVYYTVHGGLMQTGIDHWALHLIGVGFILLLGWKLSHLFNLCLLHRLCVVHMCGVASALVHSCHAPDWHSAIERVMIVTGVLLITLLLWQQWMERKN